MAELNYYEQQKNKNTEKIREMLKFLPPFCGEFFRSMAQKNINASSRLAYAYDLRIFFEYALDAYDSFKGKTMKTLTLDLLDTLSPQDIDAFLEYVTYYQKEYENSENIEYIKEYKNDEKGKARKIAALRSMYRYFLKREKIISNPSALIDTPKIHDKAIVRLDANETADLLDEVEFGENLTDTEKRYHNKTKNRDLAIVSILVGTGMRVSECVGINIEDLDFENYAVKITRKGGNQSILYFGEEVAQALKNYIEERKQMPAKEGSENALFLSLQGKRIGVRAVQNLVAKYSKTSVKLKHITPHKLRSTYGTSLYQETGDIYLDAEVLGHADVNTTKKHYAEIETGHRRSAAKYIKLRKD